MIHRMDGGTDRFTALALATNTEPLLQTIEYTKNYYYDLVGRRTNSDFKRAHSLDSEISAAEKNCQAIETSRYLFLKKFLREYSMLFDIEINLENLNGELTSVFDKMELGGSEDEAKPNDNTNKFFIIYLCCKLQEVTSYRIVRDALSRAFAHHFTVMR